MCVAGTTTRCVDMMLLLDVMCGGREPRRWKSLTRGKVPRSERKSSLTLGVDGCISMYWERGGCVEADKKAWFVW